MARSDARPIERTADKVCRSVFGMAALSIEYPGGRSRESIRLRFPDHSVIATRRSEPRRGRTEANVLDALATRGAAVPRMIAFDRGLLLQEDMGGRRLAQALVEAEAQADEAQGRAWLDNALSGLATAQAAGSAAGLEARLPVLGRDRGWLRDLFIRPAHVGAVLKRPAPPVPEADLIDLLAVRNPRFVKWDARPGNAIAGENGRVAWIDWEHCGCRNRLDDVVWLLCDEFVPDWPDTEDALLARHMPTFADDLTPEEAEIYLASFGTFHMLVRLGLILHWHAREKRWWDWQVCLKGDKVGVTRRAATTLCRRASRWAARSPLTEALAPWFLDLIDAFPAE